MIITEAEVRALLNLATTITDNERAVLGLVVPAACARVIEHLGYDPEQDEWTELLPRLDVSGGINVRGGDSDEWRLSGNRAAIYDDSRRNSSLQLTYLPVRSVTTLYVDEAANAGQASGAFAAATLQTKGTDYWIEFDVPYGGDVNKGLCRSGCLMASGAWPNTPGTVKVTYRAGYSPDELRGRVTADATDSGGVISQKKVNASGIHRAALLTAIKGFHTAITYQKTAAGFTGPLASESMGDYSYSGGGGPGGTDLTVALPPEARQELEPFVNYGAKLRG